MIHLPTAAGGRVEHVARAGQIVTRGTLLARIHPEEGPVEEIVAPVDAILEQQRLRGRVAPQYARVVGLRRVVLSTCAGRVRWIATLGPVELTTMVALIDHEGGVRPHRAGTPGFVGQRYVGPGERVEPGQPLIEVRGEDL